MSRRLDHIDGLRGLAALLVLYQHLAEYCGAGSLAGSLAEQHLDALFSYIDLGKVGVVAFFAISGFIVPYSFTGERPQTGFVVSRFFRLYPAYWLSLAVAALLLPLLGSPAFGPKQVLVNLTMLQELLGQKDVLGVYWTLLIELLFYASCMVGFAWGVLRSPRQIAVAVALLLVLGIVGALVRGAGYGGVPVGLPLYLALMWCGAGVRLAVLERVPGDGRWALVSLAMLVVAIPLIWCTAFDDHSHKESVLADVSAFYVGLAAFLACVQWRLFARPWLVYVGGISYSIYLFHPLALELGRVAAVHAGARGGYLAQATLIVVTLLVTWLTAHAVQRCIETPAIKLGKRLAQRLTQSTSSKPTANLARNLKPGTRA
jgi:peptidoglycan/LPS O-acetylase OafA/YrhL